MLVEQLLFSIVVNAAGILAVVLLREAPPRLIAGACLLCMLAVFVPWHALGNVTAVLGVNGWQMVPPVGVAKSAAVAAAASGSPAGALVLVVWLAVAGLWMTWTLHSAVRLRRRWRRQAIADGSLARHVHPHLRDLLHKVALHRVRHSRVAVTTGVFRPEVWIGDGIEEPHQLAVAVNHELSHIAAGDHYFVHALALLERLLWWNPLIWGLGRIARRHLEYACDQRCKRCLGERAYRVGLAELALHQIDVKTVPILALGTQSGVIERMERISRTYTVRPRHALAVLPVIAALAMGSSTLASDGQSPAGAFMACNDQLPEGVHYRLEIKYDANTQAGDPTGALSLSLRDELHPDTGDQVPEGAGAYIRCLFSVLGIPQDEVPPSASLRMPDSKSRGLILAGG